MAQRALIVIDVQNEYFPGGAWALPDAPRTLPNILRLIEQSRERGEAVVFIRHVTPETAPVFARGSKGSELHQALSVRPEDPVLEKAHPSSFQGTGLLDWLKARDIKELDICGYMTQMCCDTTTREAYARGYTVRLFSDATCAKDQEYNGEIIPHSVVYKTHLATLSRFAKVIPTAKQ
ncbi:MAG: cysteine hydrolase [Deltaproteobacteria bacterium]|nr:cysteine hydrolase [Deltaproteobacteria bacterium]